MNGTTDRTRQHLDDLARMLDALDPQERADVLDGVRDHVDSALGALGHEPTAADVDRVLAELGSPGDVAREALAGRAPVAPVVAPAAAWPALAGMWVPPTVVGLVLLGAARAGGPPEDQAGTAASQVRKGSRNVVTTSCASLPVSAAAASSTTVHALASSTSSTRGAAAP